MQSLAARAQRLKTGRVDPSEDNMLKITSEGRKAALDLRLIKPAAPDEPQGKVNLAVEKIFNIWQESKPERSAQLVFCDLSTPKDRGFSVYNDMAQKLERLGIPGNEIAFIQDYDSDISKLTLFRDVRAGKVRVLFGSTQKMGSGTNVHQAGWTQEVLAGKMQLLGCYITRDIIAQIETRRSTVNDERVMFFARVFGVEIGRLFPQNFENKSPCDCRKQISVI